MIYDMDFFRKVNNGHGSESKKESALYELRNIISRTHTETIDCQARTKVDGIPTPLIVMDYHGNNSNRDRIKKIEAPLESVFYLGSKIDCFGLKWLVTEINYNREVKLAGRMQLCNYVLKWQGSDGEIVGEDCVVKQFHSTSTGEQTTKVITTNDTRRNILMQMNPNVLGLAKGKRLFVDFDGAPDAKVYEITNIDRITYIYGGRGFFEFTLTECEKTDADRADLMIADYRDPGVGVPAASGGRCYISYIGTPQLKTGGSAKTFTAVFKGVDNEVITGIAPKWELILPPELEDKVETVSLTGSEIRLRAKSGGAAAGRSFILKMTADDETNGHYECETEIRTGGLI